MILEWQRFWRTPDAGGLLSVPTPVMDGVVRLGDQIDETAWRPSKVPVAPWSPASVCTPMSVIEARDPMRLERLCKYAGRPAVATERRIGERLTSKSALLVSIRGFSRFALVRKIEWPQITRPLDPKNLAPAKSLRLLRITFFSQEKA